MLEIDVVIEELFDSQSNSFIVEKVKLQLEHSLLSLSKWESFFEKPFLTNDHKTEDEALCYIKTMCLTPEIPPEVFRKLTSENFDEINRYIGAKMTATWFNEKEQPRPNRKVITSEVIYSWMVSLGIPFTCETWHLNRLMTLIKVCNEVNAPKKKMSRQEMASRQRTLNAERKRLHGTQG